MRGPAAFFTVISGILDDLAHTIKLFLDHDLAQVVLFMAIAAALATEDILAHALSPILLKKMVQDSTFKVQNETP
jgi:hypothetical protein